METECSLPCSEELSSDRYPEPVESSPYPHTVKKKDVPVLNWAPRHEDVLGEWSLTSAVDGSGQLRASAALLPVPIG
jgi:hypothetical protein